MHKTIYIDIDEEITSVLDKIRDEKSNEICIVIPKNAAVTQGVINLKLLKKEATKYGKTIVIATNDPQARKVIKRLEIKTQEIAEADLKGNKAKAGAKSQQGVSRVATREKPQVKEEAAEQALEQPEGTLAKIKNTKEDLRPNEIGSETFFDGIIPESLVEDEAEKEFKQPAVTEEAKLATSGKLKKELYNKKQKTTLNKPALAGAVQAPGGQSSDLKEMSELKPETVTEKQAKTVRKVTAADSGLTTAAISKGGRTVVSRAVDFGATQKQETKGSELQPTASGEDFKVTEELNLRGFDEETSKKAEEFFGAEDRPKEESVQEMEQEVVRVEKEVDQSKNQKGFLGRWGFALVIMLLFVGIGGGLTWGFMHYPQAEITIYPRKKDFSKEIKITVKEGVDRSQLEQGIIPGQYQELTIKKTMKFNATGETYATDDGKAKGKVTIYNKYSEKEQPLVKTTRVLSQEGKLFRLAKDVTVPGMTEDKPGVVEVAVIADKPGEDFNIGSSTFTIEGFKGSSKYKKFEVRSFEPMTDGGSPDSNKRLAMISAADISRAREKTVAALEKSLEEEVQAQLGEGMSAMFDSVEKEIVQATSTNEVKDVAKSFSYTVEQKVKLIAFATADVNSVAVSKIKEDIDQSYAIEESQSKVTFKKSISDFENRSMTMYLDSLAVAWPQISAEQLAHSIANKKEEEIRVALQNYPVIEKVEFLVKPSWLTGLPIAEDRIKVKMVR